MSQSLSGRCVAVAREPPRTTAIAPGRTASSPASAATWSGRGIHASLWCVRAAVLNAHDRPPEAAEFGDPPAGADGVVEVAVAAINPIDLFTAAGGLPDKPPLPSVVGRE